MCEGPKPKSEFVDEISISLVYEKKNLISSSFSFILLQIHLHLSLVCSLYFMLTVWFNDDRETIDDDNDDDDKDAQKS